MRVGLGPGSVVAGHRLLRLLGTGVQSQVHQAVRLADGVELALKLAALGAAGETGETGDRDDGPRAREGFLRAATLARSLEHPHIVRVFDAGVEGPLAWLSMELMPGGDLVPFTAPGALQAATRVLTWGHQLALALAHAHRHGVVHRDLKAGNVLLDAQGEARLADFGLARSADALHTGTGIVPGTPFYMAPELLAGNVPGAASDLYSLGVLLFELLTGRRPHVASTMGELLRRVAREPAPDLAPLRPDLPPALGALLARLLAKQARERGGDADAVATQLQQLQALCAAAGSNPAGPGGMSRDIPR